MLLYVQGARLLFGATLLVFLTGSSLLSPPNPHLLLLLCLLFRMLPPALLLLSECSRGGRRKRGEVGLPLTVAWLSALSHGEVPERPLVVAGGLLQGRAACAEMVVTAGAVGAAWCDGHGGE